MVNKNNYDFAGWATCNDIQCSDGRTIKHGAFSDQNGAVVPLVWNHGHSEVSNVLGHALLEDRKEGVYCYCSFNNTPAGQEAKELVKHGDINCLSIFANKLKQNGKEVIHGMIREVSLVLSGANPGAFIEDIAMHDEEDGMAAQIYNPVDSLFFMEETTEEDIEHACGDSKKKKKKSCEHGTSTENVEMEDVANNEDGADDENDNETIQDVVDSMTDKQRKVMYFMIGQAMSNGNDDGQAKHSENNMEDENCMKNNVFDNTLNDNGVKKGYFSHAEEQEMIKEARNHAGSLKEVYLAHVAKYANPVEGVEAVEMTLAHSDDYALMHSITNYTNLYPEVQPVNKEPKLVQRNKEWVSKVLGAVNKVPFARIKSTYVDITADNARARGYVTGAQKVEEVIVAAKRTTDPTTIYKLQKIDRDIVLDITDFDVVAFMKKELDAQLDEEFARAILIGDGRSSASGDKIDPTKIRPIWQDDALYTINNIMERGTASDAVFGKAFIDKVIAAQDDYEGNGNPSLFIYKKLLTKLLLLEDTNGHKLYKSVNELATAMGVKEIVKVDVFNGVYRAGSGATTGYNFNLLAVLVDLADYTVGNNKGGEKNMFDDFDLNYNKLEYLEEIRKSGALVVPHSAITFEEKVAVEQVNG